MTEKRQRILITGSSGQIGAVIAEHFAREAEVIGLDLKPGRWTTILGDITDVKLIRPLVSQVDTIVHTASLHAPHVGLRNEEEFSRVNVDGTRILLEASLRAGGKRFVFTSTTSVYGCTSRTKDIAIWVTEELETNPEDIYDITKIEAENLCREASSVGMDVVVLRLSRCLQEPENLIAFHRLYRGIDVRDAAEGHWLAATRPLKGFHILNLSGVSPFKISDIKLLWKDPWRVIDERAPGFREAFLQRDWEMPSRIDRVYVIEKAKSILGFKPKYDYRMFLHNEEK